MFSQVTIIGRLGKDPELRFTPTGQQVATFPVATDHQYTDHSGQLVKITTWFRVAAWGKMAENCSNYLKKGKLVMVQGELSPDAKTGAPRIWTGDDGMAHATYELNAWIVKFLSPSDHAAGQPVEPAEIQGDENEIPY
ncbi:MAG: single-stranded DNA-binding protein [Pelolinea sp.]|nr:single-stranded DNA-binding protein [Pelolinea sp.]